MFLRTCYYVFIIIIIKILWHFTASRKGTYLCLAIWSGHSGYLNAYLNKEIGVWRRRVFCSRILLLGSAELRMSPGLLTSQFVFFLTFFMPSLKFNSKTHNIYYSLLDHILLCEKTVLKNLTFPERNDGG